MRLNKTLVISCIAASLSTAAFAVNKNGASLVPYEIPGQGFIQQMSDNGQWVVYCYPSNDEPDAKPLVIDVANGRMLDLEVELSPTDLGATARSNDVSNDGKIVAGTFNKRAAYYSVDTKQWTRLPNPKGFGRGWTGEVLSMTPDAKVMVGWLHENYAHFDGAVWIDGVAKDPASYKLPDYDEMYKLGIIDDDDKRYFEGLGQYKPDTKFIKVSADGKKVLSGVDHHHPAWGCSYIIYDLDTDTYEWILDRNVIPQGDFVEYAEMSNNGKYVLIHTGESGAFVYEVETKKYTRVSGASIVDNYGNVYSSVSTYDGSPVSSLRIPYGSLWVDMYQMLEQTYDIDYFDVTKTECTGFTMAISDDCKVMACMSVPRTNAYVVSLPKTFIESCEGVNLLTEWAARPASGESIALLDKITISLSYGCSVNKDSKVTIMDENDKVVAQSVSAEQANRNSIYNIMFEQQTFEAGKKYKVVVPEGFFFIEGTDLTNKEMVINYTGRENTPLAYSRLSPAEGEILQDISMTNPMYLTFPATVVVADGATANLYEKGGNLPLAMVALEANGNILAAYTTSGRKLLKDVDYEVRFPEGCITDVTGNCANKAFTVKYTGAYINLPPGPFKCDFNDPNSALGQFMQYEGDHNKPTDSMASLGFDADNTPWNFSLRDSEADGNYYAGSHSMYSPAGQSDDWMVIRQLDIMNPDYYLTFLAQSFLKSKNDVLKVMVWESDDVIYTLDAATFKKMKAEAKTIFEKRLSPGETEATCKDEWENIEISLADFSGKKIYIAFVNQNADQSAIFLDDIEVLCRGKFDLAIATDDVVVAQDEVVVKCAITNNHEDPIKSFEAYYESKTTDSKDQYKAEGISIAKGESYQFSFSVPMKLVKGVENNYTVTVAVGDAKQALPVSIKNLNKAFDKKVVIEELTGAWCGNCPQGTIAFDYLEQQFPGQVVPIAIHNNDPWAYPAYESFVNGNGYPSGRVNRGELTSPMISGRFFTPEGNQTWYDVVVKELATPADTEIKIKDFYFCKKNEMFEVLFDVDFAIEKKNISYNVLAVVLEDELPITQTNYFYGQSDPIYGEWGEGGKFGEPSVETVANHVPRGIAGTSFYGFSNLIARNPAVGVPHSTGMQFTPVATYHWNMDKMTNPHISVACIVLDGTTGKVVNADVFHGIGLRDESGIEVVENDALNPLANISFNVIDGKVFVNGADVEIEVYTISGARVANEGLNGLYIVRAVDANGNAASAKLVVK